MSIYSAKLVSGEEIIFELVKELKDVLYIKMPLQIAIHQSMDMGIQIGFLPFMISYNDDKKEEIEINTNTIIALNKNIQHDLEKAYLEKTTSIALDVPQL